jgi:hypothetical protein
MPAHEDKSREDAERVRAHLVSLRGGAPFLSSVDARILQVWLEDGTPVARILEALETVARRRQARRTRTPFTLKSIAATLRKTRKARPAVAPTHSLEPLASALRASENADERALAEEMASLEGSGESLVERALELACRFRERAWDRADKDHLRAEAAKDLRDFADQLSEKRFDEVVEEVARARLFDKHPLLAASTIWDTVCG